PSEPSFETCLADSRFTAGNERLLAQFRTEVAGMLVRHYCAFVALYARTLPNGRAATTGSPYSSVGGTGISVLPVSGGAIRRDRCDQGALRPTAPASAPRPGRGSIGPRGRSRPHGGRRPP